MAAFAALLSTCFFIVGSLATPCVHDEVAMFQGKLHIRSHQHLTAHKEASLSLETIKMMAMGTSILQDADDEIQKMKDYLYKLEMKSPFQQSVTMQQIAGWLPHVEAMDKDVVAFAANISTASWDWVDIAYNTHGAAADGLHDAAKVFDVLDMLPTEEGSAIDKLKDAASSIVDKSDKMVNGLDQATDEMRWQTGNKSLSNMKQTLKKLMDGKAVFDEEVELYKQTLVSVGATAWVTPDVKDAAIKAPEAVGKLHSDYTEAYQSYVSHFEQAFTSFDITKERFAKAKAEADAAAAKKAIEDVGKGIQEGIQEVGEGIQEAQDKVKDALAPVTDVLKVMSDIKEKMQNPPQAAPEPKAAPKPKAAPAPKAPQPVAKAAPKPAAAPPKAHSQQPTSTHNQPKMPKRH
mmetsp:Transcript_39306/g.85574  ORF Transcript_39306/g.85574 Transcript_39306/m.85574 type:complete len:405 (+) Transcript_39306:56-1270(+)